MRSSMNKEEENVRDFYNNYGWVKKGGVSGEAALFRDSCPAYYPYHDRVNTPTMECFANQEGRLLLAGGGDLPETHVAIANKFSDTTCLDISKVAIDIARQELAGRGQFVVGSILDIPKPNNYFDAVYYPHVLSIGREHQAKAVRELIRVTNPGRRIEVIYVNPDALPNRLNTLKRSVPMLWRLRRQKPRSTDSAGGPPLYFFAYPFDLVGSIRG
jgi:SAM-dependent methyltransferase